jgi:divalent metal cation (Fe/Co/Zn/Cd) transporter
MTATPLAVERGRRLQYFTIAYNCLEGVVAIAAGMVAGSVSLTGFGIDSLIEVTSGAAVLWRLRDERAERATLRVIGVCFLALAAYILYEAVESLLSRQAPERSVVGIALAAVSIVVMPLLAKEKRKVATALGSATMRADSRQTDFCAWLSAILLGGLVLNAVAGWWWADPVAGLVMAPIIAKEGFDGIRARTCSSCGCH